MRNWKETELGEVVKMQKGYAFKSRWYSDSGRPIVKVSNFTNDSVDCTNFVCIPEEIAKDYLKYQLDCGDILIQTVGSWPSNPASVVGKTVRVPNCSCGALLNQNAVKLDPENNITKKFLYYLLRSESFKNYITNTAQGAASQAAITLKSIRNFRFKYPPLPTQRKIASILSAYDDLIENNLRRIEILEEMARLIYREWFVHFRFPGHENVRMVDSPLGKIPEGWEARRIGEVCEKLKDGDWIETKDQGGRDYRLLQVSNIGVNKFIETENYRFISQDTFSRLRCSEVIPGDILISRMPKPTGRAWLVPKMPWKMVTAVDVAIAKPDKNQISPQFLLYYLNSPENLELMEKYQTGTTRPRITRKNLEGIKVALPPLELQEKFEKMAAPKYNLFCLLFKINKVLQKTRDLLLPKLISGEIDVSDLDIDTGRLEE